MTAKIKKILVTILITLLALVLVAAIGFRIYTGSYYRADLTFTENIAKLLEDKVHSYSDKNGTVFIPHDQEYKAVIVFYPGGKVEYTSYNGLMYELAARGYVCLLPRMPENLAFLKIDAVNALTRGRSELSYVEDLDWYLAGHSLGGVAASMFLGDNLTAVSGSDTSTDSAKTSEYSGIILCASYLNVDLSNTDLRLLSIYGSEDKVLDMNSYEERKKDWPSDSKEYVIQGGIHSFFGSYGIQSGDGTPSVTNEEQITETADVIANWIGK